MNDFKVGDVCFTRLRGEASLTKVVILDIREPNRVVNWSSADQSKRCFKVRPLHQTRKCLVRQSGELFTLDNLATRPV